MREQKQTKTNAELKLNLKKTNLSEKVQLADTMKTN